MMTWLRNGKIVAIDVNRYVIVGMKSNGALVSAGSKAMLIIAIETDYWRDLWQYVSSWNLLIE